MLWTHGMADWIVSFEPDVPVLTSRGSSSPSKLKAGDVVLGRDLEGKVKRGRLSYTPIQMLHKDGYYIYVADVEILTED